jgi:hypothetical protein
MAPAIAAADASPAFGGGRGSARFARSSTRILGNGPLAVVAAYVLIALPLAVALRAWRGTSYWEFSEGVYALSARMLLDGSSLYTEILAAQPPPLFYAAAAVLAADDSIDALRAALMLPGLATGLLVALAIWRLTSSRPAAVAGGVASLLTPWTLHEQSLLMPETFAAPLLMGAALLAASTHRSAWGGAAAALAASFKLAFLLPLAALALAGRSRRRYLAGAGLALGVLWTIFLAVHGGALVENVVHAQWQTGPQAPRLLGGLWLQASWNLGPLVCLAALAWPLRAHAREPRLLLCLAALAAGSAALVLTLLKHGSYLNVLALAEPPLVALAAVALCWLWREHGTARSGWPVLGVLTESRTARRPVGRRPASVLPAVAFLSVLVAVQSLSLVVAPARPALFSRPFSEATHGWALSGPGVERAARRAGPRASRGRPELNPYIAFVARRPIPGGQPDRFILQHAAVHSRARLVALAELRRSRTAGSPHRQAMPARVRAR